MTDRELIGALVYEIERLVAAHGAALESISFASEGKFAHRCEAADTSLMGAAQERIAELDREAIDALPDVPLQTEAMQ